MLLFKKTTLNFKKCHQVNPNDRRKNQKVVGMTTYYCSLYRDACKMPALVFKWKNLKVMNTGGKYIAVALLFAIFGFRFGFPHLSGQPCCPLDLEQPASLSFPTRRNGHEVLWDVPDGRQDFSQVMAQCFWAKNVESMEGLLFATHLRTAFLLSLSKQGVPDF